jgi:hypothetical protein
MLQLLALAGLLVTAGQAGTLTQPPSNPATTNSAAPAAGTSILRGHVFAADTGLPLRKAQVRIFAGEIRENRMTTTDPDGAYEFKDVKAGRYSISANKGSYVGLSYGQSRPTEASKPLQILDNQTVERVDITLPRGSVITGRIVDEYGEPMSDVQIAPQSYQTVQGQRRLIPAGRQAQTDDMGEFRLFGIPPGQYYLTATWRQINPTNSDDKTAYAPMYYPGTDNIAQAQRLTIAVGQQVSDIVMALKPIRATRISGSATTSDGRAMSGSVMLMSTEGYGFNFAGSGPLRDGNFSINGVAPGQYTLRAQSFGPGGPADAEFAIAKVTVTGDDIGDLHLVGSKASIGSGRIIIDPGAAAAMPPGTMLMAMPVDPGPMMIGMSPGRVAEDGTFELKSAPGRARINMNGAAGWQIRAVRINGTDVTDAGLEFKPNEDISGIEVEITNKLTTITGLVSNARGDTLKDYTTIAFAQDKEKWKMMGRYLSMGRPDQDGRFKISGLAPGEYYIIALDSAQSNQLTDPEFLESVRAKASTLVLREGESRTVDLKVNSVP